MSITKDIVLANGFTASFWKLERRIFDDIRGTCTLIVSGWKDQASFTDGLDAAHQYSRHLSGAQYTFVSGKTVLQVETAIVNTIDIFAGGVVS